MNLIRFRLKPWELDELSPEAGTYLWPAAQAMDRAQAEAQKRAGRG